MTEFPLLEVTELVVRFARRRGLAELFSAAPAFHSAVDGVDLKLYPGEVLGIVGESGSGKTTLGKTLLRLTNPAAGRIRFRGTDITHLGEKALKPMRQHMQMVFQDPLTSLNPRHSIRRTLLTPLLNYRICRAAEADDMIDGMLSRVGLSPAMKRRYPHEMSGGQLQRIAIGRALLVSPNLIVADEPVSKLDVSVRAKILNLFGDMQRSTGIALIFITHDLRVARYLSDRICVMYFGKIIESGPAKDLFDSPRHPYTRALIGKQIGPTRPQRVQTQDAAPACRFFDLCPIREDRCRIDEPKLRAVGGSRTVACHKAA